jgi:DNA-binding PadR family transcriptional regulator
MEPKGKPPSPLSPAALQILAALATEDLHGYGIIQAVSAQSQGRIQIGPGTIFCAMKRVFKLRKWESASCRDRMRRQSRPLKSMPPSLIS